MSTKSMLITVKTVILLIILGLAATSSQAQNTPQPITFTFEPSSKPIVFTEKDREFALKYMKETRDEIVKILSEASDSQFYFKANEKTWSLAEVAEHVIVVETRLLPTITEKILKNPAPEGKDFYRSNDRAIIMAMTNRNTKFQAPEAIQPAGRWKTKAETLSAFQKARSETMAYMETTKEDLRNHFAVNPGMGVIDAYQWFIFLTVHSDRHLAQMKEILANPNFPKK